MGWFRDYIATWPEANAKDLLTVKPPKGSGWLIAGFTPALPQYETAYEILKKRFKIVFQSEVRKNTRTNKPFFFVIYDTRSKP